MPFIIAIDQGTSSTKSIIFDEQGNAVARGQVDLHTTYSDNGFVEQNPDELYRNVLDAVDLCVEAFVAKGHLLSDIVSCGISNQRETFVLWDKNGNALSPAIVWACKRSVEICRTLIAQGQNDLIKEKTGLIIDPYFSGTKLLWLLENDAVLKSKMEAGAVYFGTVDSWLLFKFTGGKSHKTDYTNAHRTLFFNLHTLTWDKEILETWQLGNLHLPEVFPSSSDFGTWSLDIKGQSVAIPVTSMIGDSHAAAFGEGCFEKGTAKVTLGTGSSIMMNTGESPVISSNGMLSTICWSTESRIDFALEGAIVACGSTIEWLKNELNLFTDTEETEKMALAVADNGGVYLIPAFSGLGGPHWQMDRRASVEGLTFGTGKNHIVRAALESIPYQIKDVIDAMKQDMGDDLQVISVNGGMTRNAFVIRFLTDLLGLPLKKQSNTDVSALGAAYLAGLKSGVYESIAQLGVINAAKTETILPDADNRKIRKSHEQWKAKIARPY